MGFDALDQRREMKRRFAEGNYRGALELAEQVLAANPEDAIADAIATESRHELSRSQDDELESVSSFAVDVDLDDVEDAATAPPSVKYYSSAPPTSGPPSSIAPSSQATRPTAPPGVSRSVNHMPAVRLEPPSTPAVDDVDAAWDVNSIPPPSTVSYEDTPNADATVALKGSDLEAGLAALALERPIDAAAADALARLMYEQFVAHKYTEAIATAQRILGAHPKERLALAIESQSRTALARERALVVLVVPRAELGRRNLAPSATSLLGLVDGQRTAREIAAAARLSVWEALAILDELRVEGIVVLGGELDS